MINVVTILFESITTWLCLHIVFGKKIEKRWLEVGFHVAYTTIFSLCSFGYINRSIYVTLIFMILLWCKYIFREKIHHLVIKLIIGLILVGCIEVIVMFLFDPFTQNIRDIQINCLTMIILTCIVAMLLYYILNVFKFKDIVLDKHIGMFVIISFVFFLCVKIEYEINRVVNLIYVLFFIVLSLAFVFIIKKQKVIFELEKSKIKTELYAFYGKAYEDLLSVVRRRQHDYKNELSAICSMHTTAKDLQDLVSMQSKYIQILNRQSKFDVILTKCNNPIIAGYLYNECVKYSNMGIDVQLEVVINGNEINEKCKDVIEILGVLLTNAYEHIVNNIEQRIIKVKINDENSKISIETANISDYLSFEKINGMFKMGYSTKGENRGLGLSTVTQIVNKYAGDLCVQNEADEHVNWLRFKIEI